jgi:imidazolonepropionase-like amidohydrolase
MDQLGLRALVEGSRRVGRTVIITAHRADAAQLAIDIGLVGTDIANDLAQFRETIAGLWLLQPGRVDNEAPLGELNQHARRPSTELRRLERRHPVADRDHHIEAV